MFNLDLSGSYWWPVAFAVPDADGLHLLDMSFDGQFKRFKQEELDKLNERAVTEHMSDSDLAREVLVGWRKVLSGTSERAFSAEALNQLLAVPVAGTAIMKAFYESLREGLEKNSSRPPKHGRAAA